MKEEKIRQRFENLNVWISGGKRARHKPLRRLYALGRYQQGKPRLMPYAEIKGDVKQLAAVFSPPRKSFHPEYPFWHQQNDGIWALQNANNSQSDGFVKSPISALRVILQNLMCVKLPALFGIAQALILNFLQRLSDRDFLRVHQEMPAKFICIINHFINDIIINLKKKIVIKKIKFMRKRNNYVERRDHLSYFCAS